MTDDKKQSTQTTTASHASDFTKRRRVVKGLASVPVILTLSSVSEQARANASAFQCADDVTPTTEPPCENRALGDDTPPDDHWAWGSEADNIPEDRWCVRYGKDDGTTVTYGNVDQNGDPAPPDTGNPLMVSCLCSFDTDTV